MTWPAQAYKRGREARREHPDATTWENILPYATHTLVDAWLEGWYNEVGVNHFMSYYFPDVEAAIGKENGICPYCWNHPLIRRKRDNKLWCIKYPCMTLLGRPDGRIINEEDIAKGIYERF